MANKTEKRGVGVFEHREDAKKALQELKESNFPMDQISLIAREVAGEETIQGAKASDRLDTQEVGTSTTLVADTLAASFWGSILIGLGSMAIPGLGPIIAAGSVGTALVSVLASTGVGAAATARLVSAITDLGIPKDQASVYSDRLLSNNYLIIVDGTQEQVNQAKDILTEEGIEEWGIYTP